MLILVVGNSLIQWFYVLIQAITDASFAGSDKDTHPVVFYTALKYIK